MTLKCISIVMTVLSMVLYVIFIPYTLALRDVLSGWYQKFTLFVSVVCPMVGWSIVPLILPGKPAPFIILFSVPIVTIFLVSSWVMEDMSLGLKAIAYARTGKMTDSRVRSVVATVDYVIYGTKQVAGSELAQILHISSCCFLLTMGYVCHLIDFLATKELLFYVH